MRAGWVAPFWPGPSISSVWLISRQLEDTMEAVGDWRQGFVPAGALALKQCAARQ